MGTGSEGKTLGNNGIVLIPKPQNIGTELVPMYRCRLVQIASADQCYQVNVHVVGFALGTDASDGGFELQRNYDLELMNKRPREQQLFGNNNGNSQISSIDFLQQRSVSTGLGLSLDNAKKILGMSISRKKDGSITLSQEKYIGKVLERFRINDEKTKPRNTPLGSHFKLTKDQSPRTEEERTEMAKVPYASAVGSLMYAMVCTRPDIAYAVGVVSRFMSDPGKERWEAVKWLLRYLKGTSSLGLCFKGKDTILRGYSDADLGGCKKTLVSSGESSFVAGLVEDELERELRRQDAEIDRFMKIQADRLRQAIMEKVQTNQLQLISHVQDKFIQKLREKETEVENINRKNIELELQVEQFAMEAGTWQQRAKHNENLITTLQYDLEQVYNNSKHIKDGKEGCGDSEVDDTASCCNGRAIDFHLLCKNNTGMKEMMTCKACKVNEVCMLLLPCKHLCLCKECESKVSMCPLCRGSKYIGMEVYM
ncbi:uncharacterized protein LOC143620993 [Bidens hawaiensis]|uniref:uncharacterized protein LOC143620993 n=1 Tax=Bidens hawaiensis TaxID=980011 RepID=UPI00404ADACF